jgi:hypothetical protein
MKEPQYSSKMWVHTDGRIVNIPYADSPIPEDHTAYAAQNPNLFDHTEEELSKAIGGPDQLRKAKRSATHPELHRHLEYKGWSRVTNTFDKEGMARAINIDRSYVRSDNPEHFVEVLRKLKPYFDERTKAGELVSVGIHGIKDPEKNIKPFLETRGLKFRPGSQVIAIGDEKTYNALIGEEGGRVSREPQTEPSVPTSSQVRAAIGKDPNIPSWMRVIGDSYQPGLKSFKKFLKESEMIPPVGKIEASNPDPQKNPQQENKKKEDNARKPDEYTPTMRLGHVANVGVGMEDADFWITRRGSVGTVGAVTNQFNKEHIGVKIHNREVLDPKYAYYMMMHLHGTGHFGKQAKGTTNLVNIRAEDISNIPLGKRS